MLAILTLMRLNKEDEFKYSMTVCICGYKPINKTDRFQWMFK